ncbi:MAG: hypothetical protein J6M07_08225 [Ruminococcus sp.]|nr:hypothetical protein [Ruminococcus sp.]
MGKFTVTKEHIYIGFIRTLESFTRALVREDDITVGTRIFEDFDIYVRTYLCDENLKIYLDEGWIDRDIAEKSRSLLSGFCAIEKESPHLWNAASVKTAEEWRKLMELSEEIRADLYYIPDME